MRKLLIFIALILPLSANAETIVFEGYPLKSVQVSEGSVNTTLLSSEDSIRAKVVIAEKDFKYYWASRKNIELLRTKSGLYETYVAVNGAGYIRIVGRYFREIYEDMNRKKQSELFYYFEHLVHHMDSITYYGK